MKKKESQLQQEWQKFAQALWWELPQAAVKTLTGNGDEAAVNSAGWNAYDAFVSLANEATNQFYANPLVGSLTGQTFERVLQLQQVTSSLASAFFGNLWPAIGLPTAHEMASLRTEITALRAGLDEAAAVEEESTRPTFTTRSGEGLSLVSNGRVKNATGREAQDAAA